MLVHKCRVFKYQGKWRSVCKYCGEDRFLDFDNFEEAIHSSIRHWVLEF